MKKIAVIILIIMAAITGISIKGIPVKADSSLVYTNSYAVDINGTFIPDGHGEFNLNANSSSTVVDDFWNELLDDSDPYLYYVPSTATASDIVNGVNIYKVYYSSLPAEIYSLDDNGGVINWPFFFHNVYVIGGKWAVEQYYQAIDINGDSILNGIGYVVEDAYGYLQYTQCYDAQGYIIEERTFTLDAGTVPNNIIATVGSQNMIGVRNGNWIILDDYRLISQTGSIDLYIDYPDSDTLPNKRDFVYYFNLNFPVTSIQYINWDLNWYTYDKFLFFSFKDEHVINFDLYSTLFEGQVYTEKYQFSDISIGDYSVNNKNYNCKIIIDWDNSYYQMKDGITEYDMYFITGERNWGITSGSVLKMDYQYLNFHYHFEGDNEIHLVNPVDPIESQNLVDVYSFMNQVSSFFSALWSFISAYWLLILIAILIIVGFFIYLRRKDRKVNRGN